MLFSCSLQQDNYDILLSIVPGLDGHNIFGFICLRFCSLDFRNPLWSIIEETYVISQIVASDGCQGHDVILPLKNDGNIHVPSHALWTRDVNIYILMLLSPQAQGQLMRLANDETIIDLDLDLVFNNANGLFIFMNYMYHDKYGRRHTIRSENRSGYTM